MDYRQSVFVALAGLSAVALRWPPSPDLYLSAAGAICGMAWLWLNRAVTPAIMAHWVSYWAELACILLIWAGALWWSDGAKATPAVARGMGLAGIYACKVLGVVTASAAAAHVAAYRRHRALAGLVVTAEVCHFMGIALSDYWKWRITAHHILTVVAFISRD
jgi:hypothetical protein